jgi:hypothetical protein
MKFESFNTTPPVLTALEATTLNRVILSPGVQSAVRALRTHEDSASFGGNHSQDVPIRRGLEQNILIALAKENVQIASNEIQNFVGLYPNPQ